MDGPFGCVPLVGVGRSILIIDSLVVKEGNECVGCLVVQALKVGAENACRQDLVGTLVCLQDLISCPRRHGFDMHVVTIEIVEDEHVIVPYGGGMREMAGLIYEDLAGYRETLCKHGVDVTAG